MKEINSDNNKKNAGTDRPSGGLKAWWEGIGPARRDRFKTWIITGVVVLIIIAYAVYSAMPDSGTGNTPEDNPRTEQSQPVDDDGAQEGISGADTAQDPVQPGTGTSGSAEPLPVKTMDADGYSYTGGQSMTAVSLSGEKLFTFNVPLGFMTRNSNNSTWLKPEEMDLSVQSSDPFRFAWSKPAGLDSLLEQGWYDFLSHDGTDGGMLERSITAVGYYMSEKLDGSELPVILAHKTVRYDPSYENASEDVDEYYIIADCGGSYFTGTVDGRCLELMYSQRYPNLDALARAMIPASSEPGFPAGWTSMPEQAPAQPSDGSGSVGDAWIEDGAAGIDTDDSTDADTAGE